MNPGFLFQIGVYVILLLSLMKLLSKVGIFGEDEKSGLEEGNLPDEYKKPTDKNKYTTFSLTRDAMKKIIVGIGKEITENTNVDEDKVIALLKQTKTKNDLKLILDGLMKGYKIDLLTFVTKHFNDEEKKLVANHVKFLKDQVLKK